MTDADLDSLEKLLSEGSPAPWTAKYWQDGIGLVDGDGEWLASCGRDGEGPMEEGDAALCAALRNHASAMIEEIRASRAWRKEAEGLLREARLAFVLITKGRHCDKPACTHRACCQAAIALCALADLGEREETEGE